MNIVLDTNSLIMSILPNSLYRSVWDAFLRGDYTLCITNEIIVTEDKHFNVLKNIEFPHVDVIGIDDFKDILGSSSKRN